MPRGVLAAQNLFAAEHAGWIAAAGAMASTDNCELPIIVLFPEVNFNQAKFLKAVKAKVQKFGYCSIVVSEGACDRHGKFLADQGLVDAFGHVQLGGVAPVVANMVKQDLGYKYHWAVADYLQRAARHIASKTDAEARLPEPIKLALLGPFLPKKTWLISTPRLIVGLMPIK